MRVVAQRVSKASVVIDGKTAAKITNGLLVFAGMTRKDGPEDIEVMAEKLAHLRIFADDDGKMNLSVLDAKGSVLVVSQFTLYADCRKGRRPSFIRAAENEKAAPLIEQFVEKLRSHGLKVETGVFGAMMDVDLRNHGPVTIILESSDLRRPRSHSQSKALEA